MSNYSPGLSNNSTSETLLQDILTELEAVDDTPEYFEDTSFVAGDSPVVLDINTALGRNATDVTITNDGNGDFLISTSTDGIVFGDDITIKNGEVLRLRDISINSLRITWIADSSYRVIAI